VGAASIAVGFLCWAGAPIPVSGETSCPTPAEVARALAPLSPPIASSGDAPAERAEIVADPASGSAALRLRLLSGDGTLLREKVLAARTSCGELAEIAAVVFAAWLAQLHAAVDLGIEAPALVQGATKEEAVPGPARAPTVPPPSVAAPWPSAAGPVVMRLAPSALSGSARRWSEALGAGLLVSSQNAALAPGAALDLRLRPEGLPWIGVLTLMATRSLDRSLGPGQARWKWIDLAAGLRRSHTRGRLSLDEGIDLAAGLLSVEGVDYTTVRGALAWDVAGRAGLRFGVSFGRIEPWVGAGVTAWLRRQQIEVTGISEQIRLSPLELRAGAGISVRLGE
jgi:hypothetical protein